MLFHLALLVLAQRAVGSPRDTKPCESEVPNPPTTAHCRTITAGKHTFHSASFCTANQSIFTFFPNCFARMRDEAHNPWKDDVQSLWAVEQEAQSYLYLRLNTSLHQSQRGIVYAFQATVNIPLLVTATTKASGAPVRGLSAVAAAMPLAGMPPSHCGFNGNGGDVAPVGNLASGAPTTERLTATADGIRALFDKVGEETVEVLMWWADCTLFEGPPIKKGTTITCTKKNVLRIAFGIQGGISQELRQSGCGKEPALTPDQLQNWSVSRFSRTDLDDAFVKILCPEFDGYFSPRLPTPPRNSSVWKDHIAHIGPIFNSFPTIMDSENFVCDAAKLRNDQMFDMRWTPQEPEWKHADGSKPIENSFSSLAPCPPKLAPPPGGVMNPTTATTTTTTRQSDPVTTTTLV